MTDRMSPAARSRVMAAIRSEGTGPEVALRGELAALGIRGYRTNAYLRPTYPYRRGDMVFRRARVAVFVDGCFWHRCPEHYREPDSPWWRRKIAANAERDAVTRRRLREAGWAVVSVWEHEIAQDPAACARRVRDALSANL